MPISNRQKQYLHQLARRQGVDEPEYRTILRSITHGRSESCVDLTQSEFDQVLRILGLDPRDDARLDWQIRRLTTEITETTERNSSLKSQISNRSSVSVFSVSSVVNKMTGGCTDDWERLDRFQKGHLIDALKAIQRRAKKLSAVSNQPAPLKAEG